MACMLRVFCPVLEMSKVFGIGVYQAGKYTSRVGGVKTKEYILWTAMLVRCYSKTSKSRRGSYSGCTVSENFKNFQYFAEWCQHQVGFGRGSYHLDKDILVKGNKVYSEDICVFVPNKVNTFLINRKADRGEYPVGVHYHTKTNKYNAQCSCYGKRLNLGYFNSANEAFEAYKMFKESLARKIAEEYSQVVDKRVTEALLKFTVEITD